VGETRDVYEILVGKPEGKRPFGGPRIRCEDIIMDLRKIGWIGVDWIRLAQDRNRCRALMNMIMNLQVP
jgi:hypothetical protein